LKAGRELLVVRAFVDAGLVYLLLHRSGIHEDRSVGGASCWSCGRSWMPSWCTCSCTDPASMKIAPLTERAARRNPGLKVGIGAGHAGEQTVMSVDIDNSNLVWSPCHF